ncbi:MAG: hypothetical protein WBM81_02025 [Sedimenticolaceae bacterium]
MRTTDINPAVHFAELTPLPQAKPGQALRINVTGRHHKSMDKAAGGFGHLVQILQIAAIVRHIEEYRLTVITH